MLTLFERLSPEQLPFYLQLMQHLAARGIPVPAPQPDAAGEIVHALAGKPAAVVDRLPGSHRLAPDAAHCEQVGAMLARMHLAGADFALQQPHLRGLAWWAETVPVVLPHLGAGAGDAARATSWRSSSSWPTRRPASALPRGPIHADLFRDNVMFDDTAGARPLCGFFDFYFAGIDTLLFDIAVCLNDWCIDLDQRRAARSRATRLRRRLRARAPADRRRGARAAGAAARRGAALLDLAPVGLAPAARRRAAAAQGPDPLRAHAARARIEQPWHPPR